MRFRMVKRKRKTAAKEKTEFPERFLSFEIAIGRLSRDTLSIRSDNIVKWKSGRFLPMHRICSRSTASGCTCSPQFSCIRIICTMIPLCFFIRNRTQKKYHTELENSTWNGQPEHQQPHRERTISFSCTKQTRSRKERNSNFSWQSL